MEFVKFVELFAYIVSLFNCIFVFKKKKTLFFVYVVFICM